MRFCRFPRGGAGSSAVARKCAEWRRGKCWKLTLSACTLLIRLGSHLDAVQIPRAAQGHLRRCCFSSSPGSPDRHWPGRSGGLHSIIRAGGCTTPTGFAASAGAEAAHALTINPDHSLAADQCRRGAVAFRLDCERFWIMHPAAGGLWNDQKLKKCEETSCH
jgi:hypothetical protein